MSHERKIYRSESINKIEIWAKLDVSRNDTSDWLNQLVARVNDTKKTDYKTCYSSGNRYGEVVYDSMLSHELFSTFFSE